MKYEVTLQNAHSSKQAFVELFMSLKAKYGDRVTIDNDDVLLKDITCQELVAAFAAKGYLEMSVMAVHRNKNSFLWEDDNEGGYAENTFFLEWDGVNLMAEASGAPINEWSDD